MAVTRARWLIGALIAGFWAWQHYGFAVAELRRAAASFDAGLTAIEQQVSNPPPLFATKDSASSTLTQNGVLVDTNAARKANGGLPPLRLNAKLNLAAEARAEDMFANQYFAHE